MASWYPDHQRPRTRDDARNFLIIFLVGLALTLALLVLAGVR